MIAARQGIPLGWEFSRDDVANVLSDWQWYIVQNRLGFLTGLDQQLIDRFGPRQVIAAKWGVPLVWAFSHDDVAAAMIERG